MKRTAMQHTKMRRLMRALDVPMYVAVGVLESIWHLTAREAVWGNIGKLSNEDIALAIGWRGDESALITALVTSGWLDEDPVSRLVVHDWAEHADDTTKKAMSRHPVQTCPDKSRIVQTCPDNSAENPLPLPLPLPLPKPLPRPDQNLSAADAASPRHDAPGDVPNQQVAPLRTGVTDEMVYAEYPRKEARRAALKAISIAGKRLVKGESPHPPMPLRDARELLLERTRAYARSPAGQNPERSFIPHPATWFNQSRYLDDEANWQMKGGLSGPGTRSDAHAESPTTARIERMQAAIRNAARDQGLFGANDAAGADGFGESRSGLVSSNADVRGLVPQAHGAAWSGAGKEGLG